VEQVRVCVAARLCFGGPDKILTKQCEPETRCKSVRIEMPQSSRILVELARNGPPTSHYFGLALFLAFSKRLVNCLSGALHLPA
jgi:hypothetical protein